LILLKQIKHGWGYDVVAEPGGSGVVLQNRQIAYWPDDNPPTIAEIEAVELPPEPTPPNWAAFRLALAGSPAYRRIVGHNNETLSLLPLLTNLAFMIDTDPPKAIEFAYVWNQVSAIAEPTSEEIATLNGIASANNVPLVLNELGLMG
jgi:hypothetical protein